MSDTHTMDHFLEINGHEYQAETKYHYTKGYKGAYEGGQQVEPDEDEEIEIGGTKIALPDSTEWYCIPLTAALAEEITEEAWSHLKDGQ